MNNESIILRNAHWIDGTIRTITLGNEMAGNTAIIDCSDNLVFPGLVNSHDHLHFNLFPRLGNQLYNNYVEWGNDIHTTNKEEIAEVLHIDKQVRTMWGVYKNLLAGVTTVVHHGESLAVDHSPIRICNRCYSLHSVRLEKRWQLRLNKPFRQNWPFAIHIGEGTDQPSRNEIDQLLRWNWLRRKLVGIHGVAMNEQQAKGFEALVWCPQSNFFLLGDTARIHKLKQATHILFGTDATVSAEWNAWSHLRTARSTQMLSDAELVEAVTEKAARIWQINSGQQDVVVAKRKNIDTMDAFFAVDPQDILLVICKGIPVLFDTSLSGHFNGLSKIYSKIYVAGQEKFVVGDMAGLIKKIKKTGVKINMPVDTD